jgi:hypothetical protein
MLLVVLLDFARATRKNNRGSPEQREHGKKGSKLQNQIRTRIRRVQSGADIRVQSVFHFPTWQTHRTDN